MKAYYLAETERWREYGAARYAANAKVIAQATDAWRRANPEKARTYSQKYRRANLAKRSALGAKYRSARLQRTPPWLTQAHFAEIDGIYHFAKVMEQITGRKYHVDHIEPLRGNDVSGLHVPWNLLAIPALDNVVKGNRRTNHG